MAHKFLPNNRKLLDYEGKSICSVNKGDPYFTMASSCPDKWLSLTRRSYLFRAFLFVLKRGIKMTVLIGVIMGSKSDWETMKYTCEILDQLEVAYEKKVVSAHRTP